MENRRNGVPVRWRDQGRTRLSGCHAGAARSSDRDDLGLSLPRGHGVADMLAKEAAGERRSMGNRALCRIGFVLTDDAERLPAAIVAHDRHGAGEQ